MAQTWDMEAIVKAGKDLGLKIEVGSAKPGLEIGKTHQTWDEFAGMAQVLFQTLQSKLGIPTPVYYEVCFLGAGHPDEWNFYIESSTSLTDAEVKRKLEQEFIGVDGLTLELLEHISYIQEISGEDYANYRGLS